MYAIFYTRWNFKRLLSKCTVCLRARCTLQVVDAIQPARRAATRRCNTPLSSPLRCTLLSIIHHQGNAVRSLQWLGSATIRSEEQRRHCLYVGGKSREFQELVLFYYTRPRSLLGSHVCYTLSGEERCVTPLKAAV